MRGWKREVRAALAVPLPTLTPPLPSDDPDVIRGEREAVAQARLAAMSVCEQAGHHVFAFGRAACRCGEEAFSAAAGGITTLATGSIWGLDPRLALDLERDPGDGALGRLVLP